MTREEFMKKYAAKKDQLQPFLEEPVGSNPVSLQLTITRVRFPKQIEKIVWGSKAEMECRAEIFSGDQLLGTAELKSTAGLQSIPLLPYGMAASARTKAIVIDSTRWQTPVDWPY